jgi:hypothetical protein
MGFGCGIIGCGLGRVLIIAHPQGLRKVHSSAKSLGVEKSRVECESTVEPQPGALTPRLFDSRLLNSLKAED